MTFARQDVTTPTSDESPVGRARVSGILATHANTYAGSADLCSEESLASPYP
jgi:hypothetical protein